ncbi:MAG TPA: hypothetical protein VF447_15995 [Terriglobales bacterium]
MLPENFKAFGGGSAVTALHPLALVILVLAVLLMWFVPRRYMLAPFLAVAILIPLEQQVVVGGLHFMVLRIVLLFAWMRLLVGIGEERHFLAAGFTRLDMVFAAWVISAVVTFTILWADVGALIAKLGFLYNAFGTYFLLRCLLRTREDVARMLKVLAIIFAVVAVLMTVEQLTGRNLLAIFGLPAEAEIRNGRIRSQGPFLHSIIAGTIGAILIPTFLGLGWASRKSRLYAAVGILAALVMIVTSASSTPVATCMAGLVAVGMWPMRRYMKLVRWGIAAMLLGLHLVMKAPVWALIGRIDLAGGSTSWHRFALVDHFINHFSEWWLVGTRDNAKWGWDMWDSINWYVASGITGGLVGLVLFVAILVIGFAEIGRYLHSRRSEENPRRFAWCLGASVFAGSVSFFGISLFDQSIVLWYSLFAMIVAMTTVVPARKAQPVVATISTEEFAFAPLSSQPVHPLL